MPHCRFCLGLYHILFFLVVHLRLSEIHTPESWTQEPLNHLKQIACFSHLAQFQHFIQNQLRQRVCVCTEVQADLLTSWAGQMQATSKLEAVLFHYGVVPKPPAGHMLIRALA